jgi:hypothetical protein
MRSCDPPAFTILSRYERATAKPPLAHRNFLAKRFGSFNTPPLNTAFPIAV